MKQGIIQGFHWQPPDVQHTFFHATILRPKQQERILQGKIEWSEAGIGCARIPSSMVGLSFVEPTSIQNLSNATSTVSAAFEKRRPEELNHPSCVTQLQGSTLEHLSNFEITRSMILPFLANFSRTGVLQDWGLTKVVFLAFVVELEETGKYCTRLACARDEL